VRIGLHTAMANRRGSDYSGKGVHVAAGRCLEAARSRRAGDPRGGKVRRRNREPDGQGRGCAGDGRGGPRAGAPRADLTQAAPVVCWRSRRVRSEDVRSRPAEPDSPHPSDGRRAVVASLLVPNSNAARRRCHRPMPTESAAQDWDPAARFAPHGRADDVWRARSPAGARVQSGPERWVGQKALRPNRHPAASRAA
jgi:hypothetical protein